jgi:hypothetical protein
MAWEVPENPLYLAYAQGRATIENQPSADPRLPQRYGKEGNPAVGHIAPITHEDVALVPQSAYLDKRGDVVPTQDEGTGAQAIFDMPASFARTRYELSKDILGYVEVEAPLQGTNSPLLVVPSGIVEGPGVAPPFGGVVSLAIFQFGHLGAQVANIVADVLPGTLVRAPSASSFMRVTGRLAPRYFAASDTGVAPNITRVYLLFPGGPALTNDSFSNLPPNILELQGNGSGTIVAAGAQAAPVNYFGWCAHGYVATPIFDSVPTRVFRGTVPCSGPAPAAPFTNRARIPIPQGANSVRLMGGFFNPTDVPQSIPIQWTQNLDWGGVAGPFAPDNLNEVPIPLLQGVTSIDVFAGNGPVQNGVEVPFFAIFSLNV